MLHRIYIFLEQNFLRNWKMFLHLQSTKSFSHIYFYHRPLISDKWKVNFFLTYGVKHLFLRSTQYEAQKRKYTWNYWTTKAQQIHSIWNQHFITACDRVTKPSTNPNDRLNTILKYSLMLLNIKVLQIKNYPAQIDLIQLKWKKLSSVVVN